ncbi:hypothetical protein VNO77_38994 [Canavalia gladiata]|uniref:Uncharacterized protein n=1 Tax=Canavalia gladiata TaxID=3824 RepID=A0AAN9KBQ4_CANGL
MPRSSLQKLFPSSGAMHMTRSSSKGVDLGSVHASQADEPLQFFLKFPACHDQKLSHDRTLSLWSCIVSNFKNHNRCRILEAPRWCGINPLGPFGCLARAKDIVWIPVIRQEKDLTLWPCIECCEGYLSFDLPTPGSTEFIGTQPVQQTSVAGRRTSDLRKPEIEGEIIKFGAWNNELNHWIWGLILGMLKPDSWLVNMLAPTCWKIKPPKKAFARSSEKHNHRLKDFPEFNTITHMCLNAAPTSVSEDTLDSYPPPRDIMC